MSSHGVDDGYVKSAESEFHNWLPSRDDGSSTIMDEDVSGTALCLGTGRFLRSVLVPALVGAGLKPTLIQTRGRSFMEYMAENSSSASALSSSSSSSPDKANSNSYEVDTVLSDGTIVTDRVPCFGAFSVGKVADKEALWAWLPTLKNGIKVLGVGVTEAGLASKDSQAVKDLYDLLHLFSDLVKDGIWNAIPTGQRICIVNTDNVPNNGDLIRRYMFDVAADTDDTEMKEFLTSHVAFLNSMVDRITSARDGSNGMVPKCEPTPAKALVVLDPHHDLPSAFMKQPGVVVRTTPEQLEADINLKLRIANGTHTAIAHTLALLQWTTTDVLSSPDPGTFFMRYLDTLVSSQILPATTRNPTMSEDGPAVWQDWRHRLVHPYFGLSSFFITQNGTAKGGIRWGPTVLDMMEIGSLCVPTVSMAFAYAALLRWLTPCDVSSSRSSEVVYTGWLDGFDAKKVSQTSLRTGKNTDGVCAYADGLRYCLKEGWYEYKCSMTCLPPLLHGCIGKQPTNCLDAVRAYLVAPEGGNLSSVSAHPKLANLEQAIAVLFSRMLAGDGIMNILRELDGTGTGEQSKVQFSSPCTSLADGAVAGGESVASLASGSPLEYRPSSIPDGSNLLKFPVTKDNARSVVLAEVAYAEAIDLHTHLLPPTHGPLCLWGIDELLTYHYLVAEYFITAPSNITPEDFYAMSKQEQADLIWEALFLSQAPISEACRGVLTILRNLGLTREIHNRDLEAIREYYRKEYRSKGENGASAFCERIFEAAGIRYAIMTNIPFNVQEAKYWRGSMKRSFSSKFRSSLRVDPLLTGDMKTIEFALKSSGYDVSINGARQYLGDWVDTIKPEYMMASTPHDFVVEDGSLAGVARNVSPNMDALSEPFAFLNMGFAVPTDACNGSEDDAPSVINERSAFFEHVLMHVCEERDLPLALKIGAHRGINPQLKDAGDGVVAFADASMLGRLCGRFPRVRFLATFLSRNNQHEACVLATKFRNLHIYGCWWFCNNPSIIREITTMRIEMLGTAFTAQHSDARVMDQLLYKWPHSRAIIAMCFAREIEKLIASGWIPTRGEIRRDVRRLMGGSYEKFMAKSLAS